MDSTLTILHKFLFISVTTLFFFQSIILFIRSKNNTARKTMAIVELMWGAVYAFALFFVSTFFTPEEYSLYREKVLISGSFYIVITNFYPIQVLVPGWLNWKRIVLLLLPNVVLTAMYYGITALLGESIEVLSSYTILWASIGHFNVWFRFIFLFVDFLYIVIILTWLYGYEKKYIQWKNENFSDQEYIEISWMRFYDYILIGIFILYLATLLLGGRITVIFHCTFVIISFSYLFYKSLFYENPYPEDFFETDNKASDAEISINGSVISSSEEDIQSNKSFETNIPVYTAALKEWMDKEKPYLYHDFKLIDISHILPLNRSYLSRVVNEGFHKNFNEVVRMYRINYAKKLLRENPSLPVCKVGEMCGFRSDTTFIKAFRQNENITPTQYKAQFTKEE